MGTIFVKVFGMTRPAFEPAAFQLHLQVTGLTLFHWYNWVLAVPSMKIAAPAVPGFPSVELSVKSST